MGFKVLGMLNIMTSTIITTIVVFMPFLIHMAFQLFFRFCFPFSIYIYMFEIVLTCPCLLCYLNLLLFVLY